MSKKKKNNNKKGKKYESCEWHITYNVHLSTHYMQLWYTSILTAVTCIFVYIQEGHEVCMIHNPLYIYFFLILLYGKNLFYCFLCFDCQRKAEHSHFRIVWYNTNDFLSGPQASRYSIPNPKRYCENFIRSYLMTEFFFCLPFFISSI